MSLVDLVPQTLKRQLLDSMAGGIASWAESNGHDGIAKAARKLSSDAEFNEALDRALQVGINRFIAEYDDATLVQAISSDAEFWKSPSVREALVKLVAQPSAWMMPQHEALAERFDDLLPGYERARVNAAINFLLRCVVEELWTLPGAEQVRELYAFQFNKITAEAAAEQVQLARAQLQAVGQLSANLGEMVAQLNALVEQKALTAPAALALPRPPDDANTTSLYEAMDAHLSRADLHELCAYLNAADPHLDLDFDNLPEAKSEAILDLVAHCQRHNAFPILTVVLHEHYPFVHLPKAITAVSTSPDKRQPYSNLPALDLGNFVGRQQEMAWLRQRLASTHPARQMVIVGIGGVGKSSLAVAVADDYLRRNAELPAAERFAAFVWVSAKEKVLTIEGQESANFPDAIFHTLDDIYTAIAQTLEREDITRAATPEQQQALVQKALRNYRTLLIVDNLESITNVQVREQVKTFLRTLPPPSKAIITTREWISGDDVLRLTRLSDAEAGELIGKESATQGVNLNPTQRQQLLELTSGLPLPIKLSIARLASDERFAQVVRWLNDAAGDLPEYCVKGQVDLAQGRNPAAWKLLLAATLFDREAGASRDALGQIADLDEANRDDALTLLQRLSLLIRTEADRFWMLPIVQRYAGAQLAGAVVGEQVVERWLGWAVEFSIPYGEGFSFRLELIKTFRTEYPNLLNAVRWCSERERWNAQLKLTHVLWFYLYSVMLNEAKEVLESGIRSAIVLKDQHSEASFNRYMGMIAWTSRDVSEAISYLNIAEAIASRLGDQIELGSIWDLRSEIVTSQGDLLEAERLAMAELEIAKRISDATLKSLASYRLAEIESKRGNISKAMEWLDETEKWASESNEKRRMAWAVHLRGLMLLRQGKAHDAEQFLLKSLAMAASWEEGRLVARNKHQLAHVYVATNRSELAIQAASEAIAIYEAAGLTNRVQEVEDFLSQLQSAGEDRTTEGAEGAGNTEGGT